MKERVPTPRSSRRGRGWLVVLLLLLGAAGGAGWYFYLGPGVSLRVSFLAGLGAPPPLTARRSDITLARFERLSDSVAHAVGRYRDRARLFDNRQIACGALAPGLVTVEDRLTAYSRLKAKVPRLDSASLARDQVITAGADSVERHFDRSRCPRP